MRSCLNSGVKFSYSSSATLLNPNVLNNKSAPTPGSPISEANLPVLK